MSYCQACGHHHLEAAPTTPFDQAIAANQQMLEQLMVSSLEKQPAAHPYHPAVRECEILAEFEEERPTRELYDRTQATYLAHHQEALTWRARQLLQQIQSLPLQQQHAQLKGFLVEVGLGNSVSQDVYRLTQKQEPYTLMA